LNKPVTILASPMDGAAFAIAFSNPCLRANVRSFTGSAAYFDRATM